MLLVAPWGSRVVVAAIAANPLRRVLVVYSDERLLPANVIVDDAIRSTFATETTDRIEFYSEFLDVSRFPGEGQQEHERDFLRDKYRERPPDLVIAGGGPALDFLLKYRGHLFPGVPIVHCGVEPEALPGSMPDAKIVGVPRLRAAASTLELALRLQPATRNVAVLAGCTIRELESVEQFRRETGTFAGRIHFFWLVGLSLLDLRTELSRLPDHTIAFYLTLFQDATGASFTPRQALALFAPASRAPIYACYDTYLGHGIVGGVMVTFDEVGRKAARLGMRILRGEDAQSAAKSESLQPAPLFDWRELRRWKIDEKRLPPGSIVRFKEPTYWEQHYGLILGAVSLCALEALLIGALLIERRRRRLAETTVRESEARFRTMADTAPVMIWMSDTDKLCVFFNKGWLDFTGRTMAQELGNGWSAGVHPQDLDRCLETYVGAFNARREFSMDYRLRRSDGEYRWVMDSGVPRFASNGTFLGYIGSAIDVTERRIAEEAARDLSGRLINAQEKEQMRLARELHDDLSQSLALLSVELEMFGQSPPAERGQISGRIQEFSTQVKRLSSEVHRLSHELHPAKLKQLGLVAAMRGFCKEFAMAHETAIEFSDRAVPQVVPQDTALCLYRIAQEALQNAFKHSGATAARVELAMQDSELRLSITDDGVGFDPRARTANGSLGLVSMGERARFVHGQLSIESHVGKGTRVEVRVPIAAAQ
jgi:PAS domain S-box-containing protein